MTRLLLFSTLCAVAPVQAVAQATVEKGSISGVVRDANTGAPVAEASVSALFPPARPVQATSDAQGRYSLSNIEPGNVQLSASGPRVQGAPFPIITRKFLSVVPGQKLEGLDVSVQTVAQITGRITDQNGQPMPDVTVVLVASEYQSGEVRYVFSAASGTDDQGVYIANAQPGRSYRVMAMRGTKEVGAIADVPLNPKLRRPSIVPTYYPGVETPEGAQSFKLASGEKRENVDIRLHRAESFCAEGTLQTGGAPGALRFTYGEASPHSGTSGEGGLYMSGFNGRTGDDGKIRVCDLHPGQYRFVVNATGTGALSETTAFGIGLATISDRDAAIVFTATPLVEIPVEVVWAEAPKDDVAWPANWSFLARPVARTSYRPEPSGFPIPKPGTPYTLKLFMDDFNVRFQGPAPAGTYVKSVLYGSTDVLKSALHPGSAARDARLRIVIAHDGGTFRATVADKEGKPMADHFVIAFPVTSITEPVVAETTITGQTDQNGNWTTPMIAPGKYYVFASRTPFDRSPELLRSLLGARQKAEQADVPKSGKLELKLQPVALE